MLLKAAFAFLALGAVFAQGAIAADSPPIKDAPPAASVGSAGKGPLSCNEKAPLALRQTDLRWNVELDPHTRWQPRGGTVRITVTRGKGNIEDFVPDQACFGWLRPNGSVASFERDAVIHVVKSSDPAVVQLQVTVPELSDENGDLNSRLSGDDNASQSQGLGLVPVAALRLTGGARGNVDFAAAVPIGVTNISFSLFMSVATILLALVTFGVWAKKFSITSPLVILRLVAGKDGYASLSQFQVLVWTVVIALSAVYVMMLSGNLIDLSDGALILLGVSGASALGSKLQSNKAADQAAASQVTAAASAAKAASLQASANALPASTPDEAKAKADVAAQAAAAAATPVRIAPIQLGVREPRWVDLVKAPDGGGVIDISRVQMLLFTLIAASFVALQVLTTYVIPDIPSSFLWLMGISNGVYITNKVAS